jgi:RHS repeat-associated protein
VLAGVSAQPAAAVARAGRVIRYVGNDRAIVMGAHGRLVEEISSVPLRATGTDGVKRPVNLGLQTTASGFAPANPLTAVSIARSSSGGVTVGSDGVRITPQGQSVNGSLLTDQSVFYPDVAPDEDAAVAPTINGVELFAVLRSRLSPETIRYTVSVPQGAQLRADLDGAVVVERGRTIARVSAPIARDAQGSLVATTMSVSGNTIVLSVPHRELSVAYPVLVDPMMTIAGSALGWTFSAPGSAGYPLVPIDPLGPGSMNGMTCVTYGTCTGGTAMWSWYDGGGDDDSPHAITGYELDDISWSESDIYPGGYVPNHNCWSGQISADPGPGSTGTGLWSVSATASAAASVSGTIPWYYSGSYLDVSLHTFCSNPVAGASFSVGAIVVTASVLDPGPPPTSQYGLNNPALTGPPHKSCADPVDCSTGNKFETQTDFAVPGIGLGLDLTRTYNSQAASTASSAGQFGYGWSASYSDHLVVDATDGTATVTQANGSTVGFTTDGTSFTPMRWVKATLVGNEDGTYTYTLPDQTSMLFDSSGRLVSESDRYGDTTTMTYTGSELTGVTDADGRSITFAYNDDGTVSTATDPMGHTVTYAYTGGDLTSVTNAVGSTWEFGYDSSRQLTSETDPRGGTVTTAYDSAHRVTSQTDAMDRTTTWDWSTPGETVITDPNSNVITDTFDPTLRLISSTDASGTAIAATTSYAYDANGNLTSVTDPNLHETTYTYDSANNRLTQTQPGSRTTTWTYDTSRDVTSMEDPTGLTTTYTYTSGKLTEVSRPLDETHTQETTYAYTDSSDPGAVTAVTDPDTHTTSYAYDSHGNLTSVTDANGNETTYTYDADGRCISTTSAAGNVAGANAADHTTNYSHDAVGDVTNVTATPSLLDTAWPGRQLGSYAVPSSWAAPASVVAGPDGNVWVSENNAGNIAKVTPGGSVTEYSTGSGSYPAGLASGPGGDVWFTAGADTVGKITPSGTITNYTIAADSWATAIAAGPSGTMRFTETGNSKIGTITSSGTVSSEASTTGNPWDIVAGADGSDYFTDANGSTSYIGVINSSGTVTEYALASGHAIPNSPGTMAFDPSVGTDGTVFFIDSGDNEIGAFDVASHAITYTPAPTDASAIDGLTLATDGSIWFSETTTNGMAGQLDPATGKITEHPVDGGSDTMAGITQGPDGNIWLAAENTSTGNSIIDRLSFAPRTTAAYTYDANGNLASETNADAQTTTYSYDADNEPTGTTQPDGAATSISYDDDGNMLSQTDARGHTTSYTYDALSHLETKTDPDSHTTSYVYDGVGNLTSSTDPESRTTTYTYDANNEPTAIDYSDGTTHDVTYADYNNLGEPGTMTDATGTTTYTYDAFGRLTAVEDGNSDTTSYTYDLANNQTTITYPGDDTVTRTFDDASNLASVEDWLGNTTTFGYDPDTNLTTATFAGAVGQQDLYAYDYQDQLASNSTVANGSTLASLNYTYDPNANLTQQASTGLGDSTHNYTYNGLDQLVADSVSGNYAYDANGNPTTLASGTTALAYDNADQLTTGPGGSYDYNTLGQRTSQTSGSDTTGYAWDQAGNLTTNTGGPDSLDLAYTYDGNGLLQSRTNGSSTTQLTWDPTPSIPLLIKDGSTRIIYGPGDQPLEQIGSAGTPVYYHHDQLGSTRQLTNAAGDTIETIKYTPYGTPSIASGTATTNLLYAGQYTDPTNGLVYMRARWYEPATAQFLSVDPLVAFTGATYNYAADNPTDGIDPTGLHWWNDVVHVVATPFRIASDGITWVADQTGLTAAAERAAQFWANLAANGCSSPLEQAAANVFGPLSELATHANVGTTVLTLGGGLAAPALVGGAEGDAVDLESLSPEQQANYGRYVQKLPSGAGDASVTRLPNGDVRFASDVPGRVPGSYARYIKTVNSSGDTIGYVKETYDPAGDLVSSKNKFGP